MAQIDDGLIERINYVVKTARQYEAAMIRVPDAVHGAGERLEQAKVELRAALTPLPQADRDELVERLDDEAMRLHGRGIDQGCVDSSLSANLAYEASARIQQDAVTTAGLRDALEELTEAADACDPAYEKHPGHLQELSNRARATLSKLK